MILEKCNGLRGIFPACLFVWMSITASAQAWKQEYIVTDPQSNTTERYCWDSDHQPRYNDILAERINSVRLTQGRQADAGGGLGVGWPMPGFAGLIVAPVGGWHYDDSPSAMRDAVDGVPGRAGVGALGWRLDSQPVWGVRPWAQIRYNQLFSDDQWQSPFGPDPLPAADRSGGWVDVAVGADMPLNRNMAAWAALSQADNTTGGPDYLYIMGVSAHF